MNKTIHFFYPKGERLTGQELASKLIINALQNSEWDFKTVIFPAFDREAANSLIYYPLYLVKVLFLWLNFIKLLFAASPILYINLGQSYTSILRDGLPFIILSLLRRTSAVISLHGHIFTSWPVKSIKSKLFITVLKRAQRVTVLGENQRKHLISLGLNEKVVQVVNNTCSLQHTKQNKLPAEPKGAIKILNLLFLSNLIKSKGYREYLDAIEVLARKLPSNIQVQAVLCGKMMISGTSDSDETIKDSVGWIEDKIRTINSLKGMHIDWIQGAYNAEKSVLFNQADIFIFPSKYAVEAQPIVLLEAMSSGCAIISSTAGEISSTVNELCAVTLDDISATSIADEVLSFISHRNLVGYKKAAQDLFHKKFSMSRYAKDWNHLFATLKGLDVDPDLSTSEAAICLKQFDNHDFNRGRSAAVELLWIILRGMFFSLNYLPIYKSRRTLLRLFGAQIGKSVILKPKSKVTFPWKLTIGTNSWIGEEAWIMNLDTVTIGSNVVISQRALLCTGNHNWSSPAFDLVTQPITIGDGAWVGANVIVLPGVTIGANSVVTAGSVVSHDLPPGMICSGSPCVAIKPRKIADNG